jgi:hypothetical protein
LRAISCVASPCWLTASAIVPEMELSSSIRVVIEVIALTELFVAD